MWKVANEGETEHMGCNMYSGESQANPGTRVNPFVNTKRWYIFFDWFEFLFFRCYREVLRLYLTYATAAERV